VALPAIWHVTALTLALAWDVVLALPVVDSPVGAASGADSAAVVLPPATSAVDPTTLRATARLRL
jgi:hypothetical protein